MKNIKKMILTLMVASSITSVANAAIICEKTGGDAFVCEAVLPSGESVIGHSFYWTGTNGITISGGYLAYGSCNGQNGSVDVLVTHPEGSQTLMTRNIQCVTTVDLDRLF